MKKYLENDCCCFIGWRFGVAVTMTLIIPHPTGHIGPHSDAIRVYQERQQRLIDHIN